MKRNLTAKLSIVGLIVLLSGCTSAQTLDTAERRADAVRDEMALIADAVSSFDASAIEHLQCEAPRLIELPRRDELPAAAALPLTVEVGEIETLDLSGSTYADPDPGAEFHLTSLRERAGTAGRDPILLPDVIVRVDDSEACLWAMAPPFVVLLGL